MALKIRCNCGMTFVSLNKKPGDIIVCRVCGAENVIGSESIELSASAGISTPGASQKPAEAESQPLEFTSEIPVRLPAPPTPPPVHQESSSVPTEGDCDKPVEPRQIAPSALAGKTEPAAPSTRRCPACERLLREGAVFCVNCGTDLRSNRSYKGFEAAGRAAGSGAPSAAKPGKLDLYLWSTVVCLSILAFTVNELHAVLSPKASSHFSDATEARAALNRSSAQAQVSGSSSLPHSSLPHEGPKKDDAVSAASGLRVANEASPSLAAEKPSSDAVAVVDDWRFGYADIHTPGLLASVRLQFSIGGRRRDSVFAVADIKTKSSEGLKAILLRSVSLSGNYEELGEMIQEELAGQASSLRFKFEDKTAFSERSNWALYRVELRRDGKTIETISPVKVPIVQPPSVSKGKWAWAPNDPDGQLPGLMILERGFDDLIVFASPMKQGAGHDFSAWPEDLRLTLEIMPCANDICQREKDFIKTSSLDLRALEQDLHPGGQERSFIAPRDIYFDYNYPSASIAIVNASSMGRKLALPQVSRDKPQDADPELNLLNFTLVEDLHSDDRHLLDALRGRKVRFELKPVDSKAKALSQKIPLEFCVPPAAPRLRAEETSKGVLLSWPSLAKAIDLGEFEMPPELRIERRVEGELDLSIPLRLDAHSYLDSIPARGKCEYSLFFGPSLMKVQAWIKKHGCVSLLRDNPYGSSNSKSVEIQLSPASPSAAPVVCRAETSLFSRPAVPEVAIDSQAASMLAASGSQPLRIGLTAPDMCHAGTGLLEEAIVEAILVELPKDGRFALFDRMGFKRFAKDSPGYDEGGKSPSARPPLDFLIRLRDYSHAAGNGVDVFLTKIENVSSLNSERTWRVCRFDLNGKDFSIDARELVEAIAGKAIALAEANDISPEKPSSSQIRPAHLLFDVLTPLSQQSRVWRNHEITESLMLAVADRLQDCSVLGKDDWAGLERELLLSGKDPAAKGLARDLLISGFVWRVAEGEFGFLFNASDARSGRVAGALKAIGKLDEVQERLASWCSSLSMPPQDAPRKLDRDELALQRLEDGLRDFVRLEPVRKNNPGGETLAFFGMNGTSPMDMAKRQWDAGNRGMAIATYEKIWRKDKSPELADTLAKCYHESGMHSREAEFINELDAKGVMIPNMGERLNKAKALAKNASQNLVTEAVKAKRRPYGKSDELTWDMELPVKLLKPEGTTILNGDSAAEMMFAECRPYTGEEWNPSGRSLATEIDLYSGRMRYDEPLNRPIPYDKRAVLNASLGPWTWLEVFSGGKEGPFIARAKIRLWEPLEVFSASEDLQDVKYKTYQEMCDTNPLMLYYEFTDRNLDLGTYEGVRMNRADILKRMLAGPLGSGLSDDPPFIPLLALKILAKEGDAEALRVMDEIRRPSPSSQYSNVSKEAAFFLMKAAEDESNALKHLLDFKGACKMTNAETSEFTDKANFVAYCARNGKFKALKDFASINQLSKDDVASLRWGPTDGVARFVAENMSLFPEKGAALRLLEGYRARDLMALACKGLGNYINTQSCRDALVLVFGTPVSEIELSGKNK